MSALYVMTFGLQLELTRATHFMSSKTWIEQAKNWLEVVH